MMLRVGAFLYRVHFVDEPIVHEGERCLGLCDNETHEIFVCTHTSFAQQVQIVCHEYMEAWFYHFGQPRHAQPTGAQAHPVGGAHAEKEHDCDLFGMAMTQFVMDLIHQLDRFGPDALQPHTTQTPQPEHTPPHEPPPQPNNAGAQRSPHTPASHDTPPASNTPPRPAVATKLADTAARVGLSVRCVHEPGTSPTAAK